MTSRSIPPPPPPPQQEFSSCRILPDVPSPVHGRANLQTCNVNYIAYLKEYMRQEVEDLDLHEAAYHGHFQKLTRLVTRNVKKDGLKYLNQRNHLGCTALRLAASTGHVDCLTFLLSHGASVDLADIKAQTPLAVAVKNKHVKCVEVLLEAGANPDGNENNMSTPLCWAIQMGHHDTIQMLLGAGCSVSGCHPMASHTVLYTPLHTSITYAHKRCFYALLQAGALSAGQNGNSISLHQVAMEKHGEDSDWVQYLHDYGIPVAGYPALRTKMESALRTSAASQLFLELFSQPRSLKSMCRIRIRWQMNRNLNQLSELPLPNSLMLYLLHKIT